MCMRACTHFSTRFRHFKELESFSSLQSSWYRHPALVLTPCCLEEPSWEDSLTPTAMPWWHTVLSFWLLDHRGPNSLSVMQQGCGAWWKNTVLIFGLALILMWVEASRRSGRQPQPQGEVLFCFLTCFCPIHCWKYIYDIKSRAFLSAVVKTTVSGKLTLFGKWNSTYHRPILAR